MDETARIADEILEAMKRIWVQPAHRTSMSRKFAVDRNIMLLEQAYDASPMTISQAMARKSWTAEKFIGALY